ncbi:MAG: acyl-CoA thioesterase [Zoogloeaceae bacterium]|jgi:acyl-CoA thioester hydrolase|nr:acyl-CoA thioesterase [Zoogloeaceae bacterium]
MKTPQSRWQESVTLNIPFHDLDPMEICWHGHYARYFELARVALLRSIGYDYPQMRESGYAWPVIEMFIRYIQPLNYRQEIEVKAFLTEWENRLKIEYLILDCASGKRLTRGHTMQVAVDMRIREMCLESPAILFEKLGLLQ